MTLRTQVCVVPIRHISLLGDAEIKWILVRATHKGDVVESLWTIFTLKVILEQAAALSLFKP